MGILLEKNNNQGIGKSKLFSASGVGSIIPSPNGGFIMPLSINHWESVKELTAKIEEDLTNARVNGRRPTQPQVIGKNCGVEVIQDSRLVSYLAAKRGFENLKCFVAIPQAELSMYNSIKDKPEDNPLVRNMRHGVNVADMLSVPAVYFPQWARSCKNVFKPIRIWKKEWTAHKMPLELFAPPRSLDKTGKPLPEGIRNYLRIKENDANRNNIFRPVSQIPLVLICSNGHISDIPWDRYFCAKLQKEDMRANNFNVFNCQISNCTVGGMHDLMWIEGTGKTDSWGVLKCRKCNQVVSLTGIMNLQTKCRGERPWDPDAQGNNPTGACVQPDGEDTKMRVAIVTSNAVYYFSNFSSLYVPEEMIKTVAELTYDEERVLNYVNKRYENKANGRTKADWWTRKYVDVQEFVDAIDENLNIQFATDIQESVYNKVRDLFLGINTMNEPNDTVSDFRQDEYNVFVDPQNCVVDKPLFKFKQIAVPDSLTTYFTTIAKVEELAMTTTQLGFTRVQMPTPEINNGRVTYPDGGIQPIYSGTASDQKILPAIQYKGEGLFFSFNKEYLDNWCRDHQMNDMYVDNTISPNSFDKFLYDKISLYGRGQFYILHTFSHLLMKELEFSCGYPTASLQERLYYSDQMCGVLIFTADGSEGSMGGLVWQGQPHLINNIINKALKRALRCSSDPICWEEKNGLNRAACFTCTMVSETSCEHGNMGLDRRALVDPEFGFFKDLVS